MTSDTTQEQGRAFATLRQLARRRAGVERCELCGVDLTAEHQHLLEPPTRQLLCACDACAVLFDVGMISTAAGRKFRRVPRDVRALPGFGITDAQWESLRVPIEMAFFFDSSVTGRIVALYPSPAGPTESLLGLETWNDIVADHPAVRGMAVDVEALLANRVGTTRLGAQAEYFVVPIDECFKLVGLIRTHWKGLSGGTVVWREIDTFFTAIRQRAIPPRREASHA
jgi:hypothetical protein